VEDGQHQLIRERGKNADYIDSLHSGQKIVVTS